MTLLDESLLAPFEQPSARFARVVDQLARASEAWLGGVARPRVLPSRPAIEGIVHDLRAALFPRHFGPPALTVAGLRHFVGTHIDRAGLALVEQVRHGLAFSCHETHGLHDSCAACTAKAAAAAETLIASLPRLRALLESDARAAYEGDPAARFPDETLVCYPGISYHAGGAAARQGRSGRSRGLPRGVSVDT